MRLSNHTEREFAELAERNGWEVTKRGWPDFLCFGPEGEIIAVEVKPRTLSGERLKKLQAAQVRVLDALSTVGVKCYVSDGEKLYPYQPGCRDYA